MHSISYCSPLTFTGPWKMSCAVLNESVQTWTGILKTIILVFVARFCLVLWRTKPPIRLLIQTIRIHLFLFPADFTLTAGHFPCPMQDFYPSIMKTEYNEVICFQDLLWFYKHLTKGNFWYFMCPHLSIHVVTDIQAVTSSVLKIHRTGWMEPNFKFDTLDLKNTILGYQN